MACESAANVKCFSGAGSRSIFKLPSKVWRNVVYFFKMRAAERELASLDDRILADIGMKRSCIHERVWGRKN